MTVREDANDLFLIPKPRAHEDIIVTAAMTMMSSCAFAQTEG